MRKIGKGTNQQLREHQFAMLSGILSLAKNEKEIMAILETVMTSSEKAAVAQRTAILYKLNKGAQYFELEMAYGVSPSTISKAIDQYINCPGKLVIDKVFSGFKEPKFKYKSLIKSDPLDKEIRDEFKPLKQLLKNK